jgi:hypothetical protein
MRRSLKVSTVFPGDTEAMRTLAVIFLLALGAIAGSAYTDTVLTGAQANGQLSEFPIMQGPSHAPLGFRKTPTDHPFG